MKVEILDPENPERILGTTRIEMDEIDYDKLGKKGGFVRAWKHPKENRFEVMKKPTGLIRAGTPTT